MATLRRALVVSNKRAAALQRQNDRLADLLADARKRLDDSWSVTPAEPTRMVATTFRPLSIREALAEYDAALLAHTKTEASRD